MKTLIAITAVVLMCLTPCFAQENAAPSSGAERHEHSATGSAKKTLPNDINPHCKMSQTTDHRICVLTREQIEADASNPNHPPIYIHKQKHDALLVYSKDGNPFTMTLMSMDDNSKDVKQMKGGSCLPQPFENDIADGTPSVVWFTGPVKDNGRTEECHYQLNIPKKSMHGGGRKKTDPETIDPHIIVGG